jgi:beta-galactosidase
MRKKFDAILVTIFAISFVCSPAFGMERKPVLTPRPSVGITDLSGIWKFSPTMPKDYRSKITRVTSGNRDLESAITSAWADVVVPGEWVMQGFTVKPDTPAAYYRTFKLSDKPAGQRFKLRFSAVYSLCEVFVNGVSVGSHEGGFVPFEFDVTSALKEGDNTLVVLVQSESMLDKLSCGSQYAVYPLGGITRKVQLFRVPDVHVSDLKVDTRFDDKFMDAVLSARCEVVNESAKPISGFVLSGSVAGAKGETACPEIKAGETAVVELKISVTAPARWDCEHPNLHSLLISLNNGSKKVQEIKETVGFRQIEVRGNMLLVNGKPVRLHGTCRHEVHPLLGRALTIEEWKADARLFRDMNCNYIRTSHYPPAEEFIAECDNLGLFVELEAPLCWVGHPASDHYKKIPAGERVFEKLWLANMDSVQGYPNHPSVIIRSLANESRWSDDFAKVADAVHQADPTRPISFHDIAARSIAGHPPYVTIGNNHYPDFDGPALAGKQKCPSLFGENCHLNAYNRLELATDPALRELWGKYTREMWDLIYPISGNLGQALWSGIDDTFYLPNGDTVGYGTWGPIDGWRREKPEYWGAKKAHSPVRILNGGQLAVKNKTFSLEIENRYLFSNLQEMKIDWKLGSQSGKAVADIPPATKGSLTIMLNEDPAPGDRLELNFHDPRGFIADQFSLPVIGFEPVQAKMEQLTTPFKLTETDDLMTVSRGDCRWQVNKKTGQLTSIGKLAVSGPQLMLLPLNDTGDTQMKGKPKDWKPFTDPCSGWSCSNVRAKEENGAIVITIDGKYDGAEGSYTIRIGSASADVSYSFKVTQAVNPRQVGVVFSLPHACENLSWDRNGYWDVYPKDSIARLKGEVTASEGFPAESVGTRTKPSHPWRLDNLPYGNNDFCSTKHNIITASVTDKSKKGISIDGGGKQHIRCWRTGNEVNVLVADYSNGGGEKFLRNLVRKDDRPLKVGDTVSGKITIKAVE